MVLICTTWLDELAITVEFSVGLEELLASTVLVSATENGIVYLFRCILKWVKIVISVGYLYYFK